MRLVTAPRAVTAATPPSATSQRGGRARLGLASIPSRRHPQQCLYGGTSQRVFLTQITGFARVPPVGSKSYYTHSLTHLPGGRGPDLSRTDRSRRLVSGRASRLATLIPPARNGLRIGRTHLRFGASSKHCSGHVHPSSEASSLLKPSRPRLREPVPSRQTATEPRPACAPKPRSRCASGALSRS